MQSDKLFHPLSAEYRVSRNGFDLIRRIKPARVDLFWSYVDIRGADECWPWQRSTQSGYGSFGVGDYRVGSHRIAAFLVNGPPPDDSLFTCHVCDNRLCCNPLHLFYGDMTDNQRDASAKGRSGPQRHPELFKGVRNGRAKLTEDQVVAIRISKRSDSEEAAVYGVTYQLVYQIRKGKVWKHI